MAVEKITIITEAIDRATGKLRKVSETTRELNRIQGRLTESTRKLNTETNRLNLITRKTTRGVRGFNFAWLSVMFAGMALQRVFSGIIRSQFELFGITELFSNLMTLIMLPIMEMLLPVFIKIFEVLSALPDSVKLAIGVFILLAFIFGVLLTIIGQVALAFGGFALLFPSLGPVVAVAIAAVVASLGTVLLVIGIIVVVVAGMFIAWKNNFLEMQFIVQSFVDGIKQVFAGFINIFMGILNVIKGIFLGDFELVKEGIIMIFTGLWDVLQGGFQALAAFIAGVLVGALQIVWNLVQVIMEGVNFIIEGIRGFVGKGVSAIGNIIPEFQRGGVVPGNIGQPVPILAHGGERVIPANRAGGGGGGVTINQTISVSGSNAREFEELIKRNNIKLTQDIRRLIQG